MDWERGKETKLRPPRSWCGRGVARLSSLPPKRGVWRAEMTRDLDCSQILPSFARENPWPTGPTHLYGIRLANRRATAASVLAPFTAVGPVAVFSAAGSYPRTARGRGCV